MPHLTEILTFGQGGLLTAALALPVLLAKAPARLPRGSCVALAICVAVPILAQLALSTWSLFSPTYLDHIEASVASTTQYFMRGIPVYPSLKSYTFHGLLYGPLLPELNSIGYLVGGGVLGSKLVGWAAAWLAIGIIALTTPRAQRDWTWSMSLVAGGCVGASFGSILTADRADSLLLLFSTLALWSVVRLPPVAAVVLVGLFAGLAADLKLHGPAYIVPALGWWVARYFSLLPVGTWVTALLAATAAAAAGFLLPFLPANISAAEYFDYVRLAAKHGLSLPLFIWGCTFLSCLWVPSLFVLRTLRKEAAAALPRHLVGFAALLLVVELAVTVVASKPGAGTHHMLPFVGFHIFLLRHLLSASQKPKRSWTELPAARAAVTGIAIVLVGTIWTTALGIRGTLDFDLQWRSQQAQLEELRRYTSEYPHGMLGIAGRASYALTLFRPWITLQGTLQTDYGAWMDWSLSGVSDLPLAEALQTCRIPYLFVPAKGQPFTMDNSYGSGPLFSAAVRIGFAQTYTLVHPGQYFDVYGCNVARAGLVKRASP